MAPTTPRASVVMAIANRPALVRRAIADVAAQTFTDWELVIVDDGDDPAPLDDVVASLDPDLRERVRVLHRTGDALREPAPDAGVAASSGEFVTFHEVDDTWEPTFLARTVAHLDAHPEDAGVVTRADIVHEELHGPHVVETRREPMWPDLPPIPLPDLLLTSRFKPIQLLYRRTAHADARPFRASAPTVDNWEFHLRPAPPLQVGQIGEVLAHWHQHPREADPSVPSNGAADLLYLTRYLQGEFHHLHGRLGHVEERLDRLESGLEQVAESVREYGFTAMARRKYWGVRSRLGRG